MKRIGILQSNYIPWKGYFDLMNSVDEFILFDSVQYTTNDWRNRNRIKTPQGIQWLTIPIQAHREQKIHEVSPGYAGWNVKHWKTISQNYSHAPHFSRYKAQFEYLFLECHEKTLSAINYRFISAICAILGIKTRLAWSMDYQLKDGRSEKILQLCQELGGTHYLTGPAAKTYLDEGIFRDAGIDVSYMDYSGYPEYTQLYPPFDHAVTVLDLLFSTGPDAPKYMKSFR